MPSRKPKIVIYTEDETIKKFNKIAKENKRSTSNLGEIVILEFIEKYQIQNNIENNKML